MSALCLLCNTNGVVTGNLFVGFVRLLVLRSSISIISISIRVSVNNGYTSCIVRAIASSSPVLSIVCSMSFSVTE